MKTPSSPLVRVDVMSTAVIEQCDSYIDKDLTPSPESMPVLHSHGNSLARISCLPPEILATVFRHYVEEQDFASHTSNSAPACMTVTHVCGQWRQVALECPTLWTFISSASARWIGIMLERSKNAALVVTYNVPVSPRDCLEQILSQLPRIKDLRLYLSVSNVDRIVDLLSSQPAPLLQIFKFSVMALGLVTLRDISNTIFQGHAPQLQSVELGMCYFSWTSCIFSGLRTLCVYGIATTSLAQLVPALRRMPDLEHLTLERVLIISEETELFDRVPLARLKSIALDATAIRTAATLFAHLVLPVDVKVALQLTQIEGPPNFSDLFSAMDKHPDRSGSVIRSLRAIRLADRTFGVQFSTATAINPIHSWNPHDDDIRLSIQFTYVTSADAEPTIIFDVCRMVTQDKIHTFFGSELDLPGRDFWRAGSACLPDLEVIYMNRSFIGGLIAALEIEGKRGSNVEYPLLRVLQLDGVTFEAGEPQELRDVLEMRVKHGFRIHALQLAECVNLTADEVQLFREVVADVDWDEHEERGGDAISDYSSEY
ncbi:hypothetical protein DFH29DRAFT_224156 [Suillus ampliporus]|nr:hypothetical protein DFH29DRAFT_224156 [Suillus ampliporus]